MTRGLVQRLATATAKLMALTPSRGRGKRQTSEDVTLVAAANAILQRYAVEGLLTYTFERQVEQPVKFVDVDEAVPIVRNKCLNGCATSSSLCHGTKPL